MATEAHRPDPQRPDPPRIDPQRAEQRPGGPAALGDGYMVRIEVRDPEVLAELRRYPEGPQRDEFLRLALRIGVLSLRMAAGSLDLDAIQRESRNLVANLRQLLEDRQQQITSTLGQILGEYLDPSKGKLELRLGALTKPGGELDSLLKAQLDGDSSALARTLTTHVGEQSKLFRMLSPEEAGGLRAQVQGVLAEALESQRAQLLAQFSLDEPNSALKRLADTLREENQRISGEFSLDKPDSALSRMTRAIEGAQQSISQRLTLDDPQSPLSVLNRQLETRMEELRQRADEFQGEVRRTLQSLETRREVMARSTLQGLSYEVALGRVLEPMAAGYGDLFEDVHETSGAFSRNKTGDYVTRMAEDSGAPEAGIAWEAKSAERYTVAKAREELAEARRNRDCQIGVFVWEPSRAPDGVRPLQRFGTDIILLWDPEDPATDIRLEAAYSIARALLVRSARSSQASGVSAEDVDKVIHALEQKIDSFQDMKTKTTTIANNAAAVLKLAEQMEGLVREQMEALRALSAAMRQQGNRGASL